MDLTTGRSQITLKSSSRSASIILHYENCNNWLCFDLFHCFLLFSGGGKYASLHTKFWHCHYRRWKSRCSQWNHEKDFKSIIRNLESTWWLDSIIMYLYDPQKLPQIGNWLIVLKFIALLKFHFYFKSELNMVNLKSDLSNDYPSF